MNRAWLLAVRPATLVIAVVPVAVGTACAHAAGGARLGVAFAALLGALGIQVGTNLANDAFDHQRGADGADRLGPPRVVASGLLPGRHVLYAAAAAFGAAFLVGIYLVAVAGPVVVAIGLASIAAGYAYTGGPYPLAYNGLGDLFVIVFFGFVAVCGTAFVQLGSVPPLAWAAAPVVGALATAVLVVNNVRDRETDARAGKRTLVVRFGRDFGVAEYAVMLGVAYAIPAALAIAGRPWAALPLVTLPPGVRLWRELRVTDGRALNHTLAGTARLLLATGLAFALGLALAGR
jgi:1,4-dihydroxy-2-naphthoate octaprenyltransferase